MHITNPKRNKLGLQLISRSISRVGALLVEVFVADLAGGVVEVVGGILAVEDGGGLLEGKVLGLDDHEVTESKFESDPAAVHNL